VSRRETGRGAVPPDCYVQWAAALGVDPFDFVRELLRFYDPHTHAILFDEAETLQATDETPRPPAAH
jgi:hypothetical protein